MAGPDDKIKMMEAEMNRFEAEIGVPNYPHAHIPGRPVIGSNTYHQVQQQLEQRQATRPGMPFLPMLPTASNPAAIANLGGIPPPPPPPPMLIPHQVQRTPMPSGRPPPMQKESHYGHGHGHGHGHSHHERPGPSAPPAIVSATPKLYIPNKGQRSNKMPEPTDGRPPLGKKGRKVENLAAKAREAAAEKAALPALNVGPSFSLEELGPKRSKERKMERSDKGGKKIVRTAGGQTWEDSSLQEWSEDDFRIFCGDLGNDVTDEVLTRAFNKFPSFQKAKVIRDKRTNKTKGFGFVSFKDPQDFINAMKEMNGRYVGSRPIKLRKSMWRNRNVDVVRKKEKEKQALIGLLTGR